MTLLLDVTVKVSLLMIVTGLAVSLMRRASAASRHVALTAALVAALLLPIAKVALPALPLFVLTPLPEPPSAAAVVVIASAPRDPEPISIATTEGSIAPHSLTMPVPVVASTPASSSTWSFANVLGIVWLSGAAAILLSLGIAIIRIRSVAREARPVEDIRMIEKLAQVAAHFGIRHQVVLLISQREWMPITWGFVRPAILLPASAASWIDECPARLDAVLVHEMAHIARRDAIAQRLTRLAVALFWFNPLVWLAARRARLERERACDDAVLARGLRASDYAADLVELAQTLAMPSRAAASALAMARRSQLEQRVQALLDNDISRRGVSRLGRLCAVALVLFMLPVAAARLAARPLPAPTPTPRVNQITADQPADTVVALAEQPRATRLTRDVSVVQASDVTTSATDAAPVPESVAQNPQPADQPGPWPVERDAMYRLLVERARAIVKDAHAKVAVGQAAAIDTKTLEDTLALIERTAAAAANGNCATPNPFEQVGGGRCVEGTWSGPWGRRNVMSPPAAAGLTAEQVTAAKAQFTNASQNLETTALRWKAGLVTNTEIDSALKAVLNALTDRVIVPDHTFYFFNDSNGNAADRASADQLYALLTGRVTSVSSVTLQNGVRFVANSGANTLSDAQLVDALKEIATVKNDTERANLLLELASRYAFTPEMVTLYVAAAKGMTSAAEQARVFAQPIKVK